MDKNSVLRLYRKMMKASKNFEQYNPNFQPLPTVPPRPPPIYDTVPDEEEDKMSVSSTVSEPPGKTFQMYCSFR